MTMFGRTKLVIMSLSSVAAAACRTGIRTEPKAMVTVIHCREVLFRQKNEISTVVI
jgi:hypothetical protein